ncbi:MAG: enoyl-CoA hydratase/isomerase family protein [Planctomycetes bacterium]|nr:enoyl-CoA hydratase/isomerase family protein [Planctomycetota bacterium]
MTDAAEAAAGEEDPVALFENLEIELDEDGIALVTINRPKALNALNGEVLDELREAIVELAFDAEVKVIVITGAGDKAFVAGADIAEMADLSPLEARGFSQHGQGTFATIEECPKPVIAMINGFALGGGLELALACHLRVASTEARLGLPETSLGLIPGFGGTQRLTRLAGTGVAREWILTADLYGAAEAHRVGVVNRLAEPEELWETTRKLALTIASRGPQAQRMALDVIRTGLQTGQTEGENAESDAFGLIFSTDDMKEGTAAFLEKRVADFSGR